MEEKPIETMTLHDHFEVRIYVAAFEAACARPDLYHNADERADIAVRGLRRRREYVPDNPIAVSALPS